MRKALPQRKRVKFSWGLTTLLLVAVSAIPLLLLHTVNKHAQPAQPAQLTAPSSSRAQEQQLAVQRLLKTLLHKCPLPGYCIRDEGLPGPSEYLSSSGPGHLGMQRQHAILTEHLNSSSFQERLHQVRNLPDKQGILVSAGKPHHVGNAAVLLHVLRHHLNCSLPVEIAHRGESEVDNVTRASLSAAFPPLHWLDLDKQPYPQHHNRDFTMDRYEPKIYALYHTRFQQVLMLDADNLPLRDPSYLFSAPQLTQHGVMAWLDLWSPALSSTTFVGWDSVYPLVGLHKQPYLDALAGGQGHVRRVAESGQLLLDRLAHADVLEWLWMYTSFSKDLYRHVLGDKDTFGFAFAAAGKLHQLHAVALPPGAALRYELSGQPWQQQGKWHFNGMMQYDHLGDQVFFHRTMEKWNDVRSMPPIMDGITGPLPNWFVLTFLGDITTSFNPDIPEHALQPLAPPACPATMSLTTFLVNNSYTQEPPETKSLKQGGNSPQSSPESGSTTSSCPLSFMMKFLELRHLGLPLTVPPAL
ncbi:mannosyltransferase putative-domain-containing protein [Scenedesmus sp. NREL 46B-D3]|nr:mannosyltransferase putative-domain-containing protein [Scenedesmus sp. NREL 46B-D3]